MGAQHIGQTVGLALQLGVAVLGVGLVCTGGNDGGAVGMCRPGGPAAAAWLKVPLMVCAAVWVMKSVFDAPVSALKSTWEMDGGELLSTTMVLLLTKDRLPATSLAYKT
jgi:hypothetical protein